jgi:signal peptidase I
MNETASPSAISIPVENFESTLPAWQQWVNSFCENWIFAFIIAMGIRHFCLEAFRIPTASMEPMLFGDPAFSKSDHVVVDKFLFRFTGPDRWDVTVFQFPQPEVEPRKGEQTDARVALNINDERLDRLFVRPLMYRNFVKRAVILPGDTFYIANGNIYLKQPDGRFIASRKPQNVQDELWQEVYRFGLQKEYQPWQIKGAAQVTGDDGSLRMTLEKDGSLTFFEQQFRNLYMKEGLFRVGPIGSNAGKELIELSMTKPFFTYQGRKENGIAWDLLRWEVSRMNTADLDNKSEGTLLNRTMDEFVGDVRFRAAIRDVTGTVSLTLTQGKEHAYQLVVRPQGWEIISDNRLLTKGEQSLVGKIIHFGILDDQLFLQGDGADLARHDIPASNPELNRLGATWTGEGTIAFSALSMDRDVHYSLGNVGSFLRNEVPNYLRMKNQVEQLKEDPFSAHSFDADELAKNFRHLVGVRSQMLGKPVSELTPREASAPVGFSPETAITAPKGAYLMLGDNSPQSWDSRCWGFVAEENLRGRVLAVVLPFSRWRLVK